MTDRQPEPTTEAVPAVQCPALDVDRLADVVQRALTFATEQDSTYGYSDEPGSPYVRLLTDFIAAEYARLAREASDG